MFLYVFAFIFAFILMARAGTSLVKSLTHLARFFRISEYIVAFIIMSFATSIPELFVGLSSAFEGVSGLSLGNIIGANFINITLVIGLVAFFSNGIRIESKIRHQNFWLIFFIAFMPVLLAMDGVISRWDGLVLVISFAVYIIRLAGEKEYFTKIFKEIKFNSETISQVFRMIARFFSGVLILLASSALLVWAGKGLSSAMNMGIFSFGIIFVALGTALPELAFGVRASMLKHAKMSIGNSLGSIAFNSAFIIGIVSMISPIRLQNWQGFFVGSAFLFAALLLFNIFIYTRSGISRRESIILMFLYAFFLVVAYLFQIV
ncbi:MAG TPA: sodium:calcium antiporter [bacterium]|nr:sodium:calcium antiporter [bacterium]